MRRLALLALATAALIAAGCGEDSDDGTARTNDAAMTAQTTDQAMRDDAMKDDDDVMAHDDAMRDDAMESDRAMKPDAAMAARRHGTIVKVDRFAVRPRAHRRQRRGRLPLRQGEIRPQPVLRRRAPPPGRRCSRERATARAPAEARPRACSARPDAATAGSRSPTPAIRSTTTCTTRPAESSATTSSSTAAPGSSSRPTAEPPPSTRHPRQEEREMTDIAAMKQQARATWAAGDFDAVVPFIWEAGTAAAEASQCGPGDRVLDIAAGQWQRRHPGGHARRRRRRLRPHARAVRARSATRSGERRRPGVGRGRRRGAAVRDRELRRRDLHVRDHVRAAPVGRGDRAGARGQARRPHRTVLVAVHRLRRRDVRDGRVVPEPAAPTGGAPGPLGHRGGRPRAARRRVRDRAARSGRCCSASTGLSTR